MARKKYSVSVVTYQADMVWGASVAACRINNRCYHSMSVQKVTTGADGEETYEYIKANKEIVRDILAIQPELVTEADIEEGRALRKYFQSWVMRAISDNIKSEFIQTFFTMSNYDEWNSGMAYELGCVAYASKLAEQEQKKDEIAARLSFSSGKYIGDIGERVTVSFEVLRRTYSEHYCSYFFTAITDEGSTIYFCKSTGCLSEGEKYTAKARVKSHRNDGSTQLNYVKIIGVSND